MGLFKSKKRKKLEEDLQRTRFILDQEARRIDKYKTRVQVLNQQLEIKNRELERDNSGRLLHESLSYFVIVHPFPEGIVLQCKQCLYNENVGLTPNVRHINRWVTEHAAKDH